jgi:hypothetical protein
MGIKSWKDGRHEDIYNTVLENIQMRLEREEEYTIESVRATLEDLYVRQEQGWAGKTPTEELTDSATIAAYEAVIADLTTDEGS